LPADHQLLQAGSSFLVLLATTRRRIILSGGGIRSRTSAHLSRKEDSS
jgi:hypothetical protein